MTEAEPENKEEANELEVFFTNLKSKLGGEESKDILSGVSIVAAALEKNMPTFNSEIMKEGLAGQVLATVEKLLALEDMSGCVKALKCYGALLRQDAAVDYEGDEKAREMRTTIKAFLKVTSAVLEKASGSSPGKGSPKKNEKELSGNYSALLGALVRVYNAYSFKSSKLVVLDSELATELQSVLVGAKDKQSLLAKTNVLSFLTSAPICFPSESAFQGVVESTLDIALGPFKAYLDTAKAEEAEGGGGDAAASFEVTEETSSVFSAAAALVRNNQSLLSETNVMDWTSSTIEFQAHLFEQHKSNGSEDSHMKKMPELVGVDLILELFNSAVLKKTTPSVLKKCMECKFPALLGEKIRLLVYGPKKEEPSEPVATEGSPKKQDPGSAKEDSEVDGVSEKEAADVLMLTTALFRLAGAGEEGPGGDLYRAINNVVEDIPEVAEEKLTEEQGDQTKEETEEDQSKEEGKEGESPATTKVEEGKGGEEEGAQSTAAEEGTGAEATPLEEEVPQDPVEAEEEASRPQDGLLLAALAVASGNLNFEAVKVSSESSDAVEEEGTEGSSEAVGEGGEDGKEGEEQGSEKNDTTGEEGDKEEEGKEQQQSDVDIPEERPVQFLVQDSAAQLLYTIAIGSTKAQFSNICVPSTILKMLDTSKTLPKPVLHKLLVVLLYTSSDKEKTRIALEQSSQHLGSEKEVLGGGFMNVANGLCVLSSFKIDLEALLPIKCPPEPSPPPTPPPPPLATNKFLWDALGRPEMIDGGNLPTLKRLNVKAN